MADTGKPVRKRKAKFSVAELEVLVDDSEEHSPVVEKKKRPRKQREKKPEPEKRTGADGRVVRYSATPSQQTQQRIARALPGSAHRMFLIDMQQLAAPGSPGGASHEFTVLGATGNVYKVNVCRHPSCTCPDFARGNLCKHILFVMLRVLKLPTTDPLVWQRALLTDEVNDVLGGRRSEGADPSCLADERVRLRYQQLTGAVPVDAAGSSQGPVQRPVEGDCPICFDELKPTGEALSWCCACGNSVHKVCFTRWETSKRSAGQVVSCVYCRAPWRDGSNPSAASASQVSPKTAYLNLKDASTAHAHTDTSLEALYGSNAVWIQAHSGQLGMRNAARLYNAGRGHM